MTPCAEVAFAACDECEDGYLFHESALAAIHPDLPDMGVDTLRRYIALGQWVDSDEANEFFTARFRLCYDATRAGLGLTATIVEPATCVTFLRSIGKDPA